ncbi:MAG: hypothetical protein ACPHN2_08860 [Sinimarinibacterium flocculans]|uniref:hypothetical protein n=1 Tax=Sinimarinibacterium flocculans TaxID=985250 RepID=UPI003C603263
MTDTRDIVVRVPAGIPPEDLPAVIAAGLQMQFRPGKPPLYVARDMRHVRRRSNNTPPPSAA